MSALSSSDYLKVNSQNPEAKNLLCVFVGKGSVTCRKSIETLSRDSQRLLNRFKRQ